MVLAKKKQTTKATPKAISALISRERSSIKCSISGALLASISVSSSSRLMRACHRAWRHRHRRLTAPAPPRAGRAHPWAAGPAARRAPGGGGGRRRTGGARWGRAGGFDHRAFVLLLRVSHLPPHLADGIEIRVALRLARHLVDLLLEVGHLRLAHRLLKLVLELGGHA